MDEYTEEPVRYTISNRQIRIVLFFVFFINIVAGTICMVSVIPWDGRFETFGAIISGTVARSTYAVCLIITSLVSLVCACARVGENIDVIYG